MNLDRELLKYTMTHYPLTLSEIERKGGDLAKTLGVDASLMILRICDLIHEITAEMRGTSTVAFAYDDKSARGILLRAMVSETPIILKDLKRTAGRLAKRYSLDTEEVFQESLSAIQEAVSDIIDRHAHQVDFHERVKGR